MDDFDPMGAGFAALATVIMIAIVPLGILGIGLFLAGRVTALRYGSLAATAITCLMLGFVGGASFAVAHLSPKFVELPPLFKGLSSLWVCSVALMFLGGVLRSMAEAFNKRNES